MASRTWLVGLHFALKNLYHYGTRWQPQIVAHLATDDQISCFNALLVTLATCLSILFPL
jgi:hypothetical protein